VEKAGHMMQKLGVLLGIESAILAKNMAVMRSIVEVLQRVSPVGEVQHIQMETRSEKFNVPSLRKLSTK